MTLLDESTGTEEAIALATAVAQRLAGTPPEWDWHTEGALCHGCGLLLVTLPTTVRIQRTVVVFGRPMRAYYHLTHAHAARRDGQPCCPECVDGDTTPCLEHLDGVCDTPDPVLCRMCADDPAMPGHDRCRVCTRDEPEWEKDVYLGI